MFLPEDGADNDNADSNNIIFYCQRHKIICTYSHIIRKSQPDDYSKISFRPYKT